MNDVAVLIADMVAAGVSGDLIGRVAAALSQREVVVVPDTQAERRRERDRDRKRTVRGIPQTSADTETAPANDSTYTNNNNPSPPMGESPPSNPSAEMALIWQAECGDVLPVPRKLDAARTRALAARFADSFNRDLEDWRAYCRTIRGLPFCTGTNDRGWRADLDWALKPATINKVLEGKYANARQQSSRSTPRTQAEDRAAILAALAPELDAGGGGAGQSDAA